jgi:hypothetical protein
MPSVMEMPVLRLSTVSLGFVSQASVAVQRVYFTDVQMMPVLRVVNVSQNFVLWEHVSLLHLLNLQPIRLLTNAMEKLVLTRLFALVESVKHLNAVAATTKQNAVWAIHAV